jgi:serine/threonine-protein kinase
LGVYAGLAQKQGRLKEAIAFQRKGVAIDPLDATAWTNLAALLWQDGQFRAARDAYERSTEISPGNLAATEWLAIVDLLEGRAAEALVTLQKTPDEANRLMGAALAQHELGHRRKSQQALDALVAKAEGPEGDIAYRVATIFAWRGELGKAFDWLDRAYARHDLRLRFLKIDPLLRNLRGDPRYLGMLTKMNLPLG